MSLPRPDFLDRLTSARWWTWQTALAVAGLMLAATALVSVAGNYIDERSDVADASASRVRDRRSDYEAECRYGINLKVLDIEGDQLDGMSDLLTALAAEDEPRAREIIADLAQLKLDKDTAETDRAAAVETCNAQARDLFPSG